MQIMKRKHLDTFAVLHVAGMKLGGIYVLVRDLSQYQVRQQALRVGILIPTRKGVGNPDSIDQKVYIHLGDLKSGYAVSIRKYYRIYRVFKRYDLIHFHQFHPLLAIAALLSGRKLIHTEHGTFQRGNLKTSIKNYIKKRVLGYFFLEHFYAAVVFNSHWLKDNVGLKTDRTRVIHNGIRLKGWSRMIPEKHGTFNILTVCRLVPRKRVDRLIRAVSRLASLEGVRLQIVGDGPLHHQLVALSHRLLPGELFTFYGFQPDIEAFYQGADIFVLPTESEAFGLVVLEAVLGGLVVLCFKDGGGALEIVEGVDGRLIAADEAEMARNIQYWRDHEAERRRVAQKLSERVKGYFTVERMSREYKELYDRVLNDGIGK
jgi:glycosyltransferase involved in cell wall biosynthesis